MLRVVSCERRGEDEEEESISVLKNKRVNKYAIYLILFIYEKKKKKSIVIINNNINIYLSHGLISVLLLCIFEKK